MILAFLHTSPVHIPTFEGLTQGQAPHTPTLHRVEEDLLAQARAEGITPALEAKVKQVLLELVAQGAKVIVCTCSTLGAIAETADVGCVVLRVDRAMAQKALELGNTILLVAALESTLEPTRKLFLEVANGADQKVELLELWCQNAWAKFEAGDKVGYLREIAQEITQEITRVVGANSARVGVIVLAQASMAGAEIYCPEIQIPILSSPFLGVQAALEVLNAL
jgi:hypothetical protein